MPGCLPPVLVGEGRGTPLPTPPLVFRISLRAGPQDSEPNLWSKTRCSGRILYGRWRPQHGRPAGGGAGEAQPDRRSQGHLTEFACNGPVRERRTAASPAPAPLSRILVLLPPPKVLRGGIISQSQFFRDLVNFWR